WLWSRWAYDRHQSRHLVHTDDRRRRPDATALSSDAALSILGLRCISHVTANHSPEAGKNGGRSDVPGNTFDERSCAAREACSSAHHSFLAIQRALISRGEAERSFLLVSR